MKQKKIIGIAGAFGSGKSTAAQILEEEGYTKISLGQFLEEELKKQGETEITRKMMQDLGNEWRQAYGSSILVEKALKLIKKEKWQQTVIEGFRNSEEIQLLRKEKNFILISLVVNRGLRYSRLITFKRREKLTKEIFNQLDDRDLGIGEGVNGLQTGICIAMADIFIENNSSLKNLRKRLIKTLNTYDK